jgi:hypothetical protein
MATVRHYAGAMRAIALVLSGALFCLTTSAPGAAELDERATRAYSEYVERARMAFLDRVTAAPVVGAEVTGALNDGRPVGRPAREDGIVTVPGGLVHHWIGTGFIPGSKMQEVLSVSSAYPEYRTIYKSIVGSTLLSRSGDTFRVLLRIREGAAGVTAVLDIWLTIQYFYPDGRRAYSISTSDDIREVKNAGRTDEQHLPAGQDSGYLWRAGAFTSFVQYENGVRVEMETLGLTRRFPALLGWILEPVARRLGRKSVEGSLEEFRTAVLAAHRTTADPR